MPAIQRTFVAPDPEYRKFWFPLVGSMVNLVPNTLKAPFNELKVRQALSLAIDRKKVVDIAMYGYTRPADSTGLSDGFTHYRDTKLNQEYPWTQYNSVKAIQLLKEAGFAKIKIHGLIRINRVMNKA